MPLDSFVASNLNGIWTTLNAESDFTFDEVYDICVQGSVYVVERVEILGVEVGEYSFEQSICWSRSVKRHEEVGGVGSD